MAIDPKSDHQPNPYKQARDMAPAGTVNLSRPEAGGQPVSVGDVDSTPSMRQSGQGSISNPSTAQPRPEKAPGGAVSD
jgi:hypothetical protein